MTADADCADLIEPPPIPQFVCEDAPYIQTRMREIEHDRHLADLDARVQRSREAPQATVKTGFLTYEGPPT